MRRRTNLTLEKNVTMYGTEEQEKVKKMKNDKSSKTSPSVDPQWWNSPYVPEKPYNDDYGFMNT